MKKLKRMFSLAACRRAPGSYFYAAVVMLLAVATVVAPVHQVRAAWDVATPATGGAVVSNKLRDNWAAVETSVLARNLCRNGDLWNWSGGTSSAPDGFVLTGAAGTIARTGTGESDTFGFGSGRFAAKMTRAGTNLKLTWTLLSTTEMADFVLAKGDRFQASMLGKSSTASHLRITIDDGVGTTSSSYHTGGGTAEWLEASRQLDAAATKLEVYAEVNTTDAAAYVGGFVFTFGEVPASNWYFQDDGGCRSGRIYTSTTSVGNVGAGEDNLMTYPLRGGTLDANGDAIRVTAWGTWAANTNDKRVRAYFGGVGTAVFDSTTLTPSAVAYTWRAQMIVIRTGAATQEVEGSLTVVIDGGAAFRFVEKFSALTETLASDVTIKLTGEATSNNDIVQRAMLVETICMGVAN